MELLVISFLSIHGVTGQTVLEFQNGDANGYSGCQDISIRNPDADLSYIGAPIGADLGGGAQIKIQSLVRFDEIFGDGATQIPTGSTILSAELHVHADNPGDIPVFHQVLKAWKKEDATWNNPFERNNDVGGIQTDNVESAALGISFGSGRFSRGPRVFDITGFVRLWNAGTPNWGFAWLGGGSDAYTVRASEHATVETRPKLVVTFTSPADSESLLLIHKAVELEVDAKAGNDYQLQVSANGQVWSDLGPVIDGDDRSHSIFERITSTRRFYRMLTNGVAP